jgi:hypothetical protein
LYLPEVGKVVSAFWALFLGGGHGAHLMLFSDYSYNFFLWTLHCLSGGRWFCVCLFFVSAFWAYGLNGDFFAFFFAAGYHACSALGTKIHEDTPILLPKSFCQPFKSFFEALKCECVTKLSVVLLKFRKNTVFNNEVLLGV